MEQRTTINAEKPMSVATPTYGREAIVLDTVAALLPQLRESDELLVIDQTPQHAENTHQQLQHWHDTSAIRWIRLERPSITGAMNVGLQQARAPIVLFLDDDIVPGENLLEAHRRCYADPAVWAVVGQVLQPGEKPRRATAARNGRGLRGGLEFPFNSIEPADVNNVMAGNLSVRRDRALEIGGFDENFRAPVAYRFETEFARRITAGGGRIRFEPAASIRHLRAGAGGTRSRGSHLTSMSPAHGVGDYYYALRCGRGWQRIWYIARRPLREVRTKFHLCHPWWIVPKLIGEFRGLALALRLAAGGPKLLEREAEKIEMNSS